MNVMEKTAEIHARDLSLGVGGVAWPTIGLFAALWSGIAISTSAAFGGGFPIWAASICNGVLLYYLAHINHEAFHRNINGSNTNLKWLNDAMGRSVSFAFWFSFPAFKAMHLSHHRHMNDPERDADMWVAKRGFIGLVFACFSLLNKYEFEMWRMRRAGLIENRVLIEFYLERLLAVAIVVAAFQFGYGTEVVFLWLIPAFCVLPAIVLFFTYIVHHPHTEQETIKGANVILAAPWLLPFITLALVFQNYHLIHHLYPRVPFYRLGSVFRRLRPQLKAQGAPIIKI